MVRMSESIKELAPALAKFQGEVNNPSNTAKNPQFKSSYAPLEVVINTVKPLLQKNGLSVIQSTGSEGENISITSLLVHESGEWIESEPLVLPAYQLKKGGQKDYNAQGAGSAITYARRYSLSAILGLSSEDDDDGTVASGGYKDASNSSSGKSNSGGGKTNNNKSNSNNSNSNSNNNSSGGGMSEEEKERKKQEAIETARKRKAEREGKKEDKKEEKQEDKQEDKQEEQSEQESPADNDNSNDQIDAKQEKAINNVLKVLGKKKGDGFDQDEFLSKTLAEEFGAEKLEDISHEEAKQMLSIINKAMRG